MKHKKDQLSSARGSQLLREEQVWGGVGGRAAERPLRVQRVVSGLGEPPAWF